LNVARKPEGLERPHFTESPSISKRDRGQAKQQTDDAGSPAGKAGHSSQKGRNVMSHVVVLGEGLGGTIMAYEMKQKLRPEDKLTVVTLGTQYSFVPSNPWVAVGWRQPEEIAVDLVPAFKQRGIDLRPEGAKRVEPARNRIELNDGSSIDYDYLIIATGPDLAFDEVLGLDLERVRNHVAATVRCRAQADDLRA